MSNQIERLAKGIEDSCTTILTENQSMAMAHYLIKHLDYIHKSEAVEYVEFDREKLARIIYQCHMENMEKGLGGQPMQCPPSGV